MNGNPRAAKQTLNIETILFNIKTIVLSSKGLRSLIKRVHRDNACQFKRLLL